jgi:hypothetical protein
MNFQDPDTPISEHTWSESGGGLSQAFTRPSWQAGSGFATNVPAPAAGTPAMRAVPDVAAISVGDDSNFFIVANGVNRTGAGTSLSSPLWGGMCALINEARAEAGDPPVGLLGPKIYPLIGTSSFNKIPSDEPGYDAAGILGNGLYLPGTGYDLITGLGSPNLASLIATLTSTPDPTVPTPAIPAIAAQPVNQAVNPGSDATFTVGVPASGGAASSLAYEWELVSPGFFDNPTVIYDGATYSGTRSATLTVAGSAVAGLNGAKFQCIVTNEFGVVASDIVVLTVNGTPPTGTVIPYQMTAGYVYTGAYTFITGSNSSNALSYAIEAESCTGAITYQWQLNGKSLPGPSPLVQVPPPGSPGETASSGVSGTIDAAIAFLEFGGGKSYMSAAMAGDYSVLLTNAYGSTVVPVGNVFVEQTDATLTNISTRGLVGTGQNVLIAGFWTAANPGTPIPSSASKNLIVTAFGPALEEEGLSGCLAAPIETLHGSASEIASDEGWQNAPNLTGEDLPGISIAATSASQMTSVGLTPPAPQSADCSMTAGLPANAGYTLIEQGGGAAGGTTTTGLGIVAAFDADGALGVPPTSRLVNISTRGLVGSGNDVLIAGFWVTGGPSGSWETVLLQGLGPALAQAGLSSYIPNPVITLYDASGNIMAQNTGWSNEPLSAMGSYSSVGDGSVCNSTTPCLVEQASPAIQTRVGATLPSAGSADSAMVVTLPPGGYTMILFDANAVDGTGLVAVYEVDPGEPLSAPNIAVSPPSTDDFDPQGPASPTTVQFSVTASGNPVMTYQWQVSTDGGNTWANLINGADPVDAATVSGANAATVSIVTGYNNISSHQFRCVVTNALGSAIGASSSITAVGGTSEPQN